MRTFLTTAVVAGALSGAILGAGAVRAAEPASNGQEQHQAGSPHHWGPDGGKGRCEMFLSIDKKLTPEQVRDIVAGHLAAHGEGTLKVGKVTTKSPGVVAVDIVTNSGSLVTTREISQKNGLPVGLEKRCEEHEEHMAGNGEDHHSGHFRGHGMMGSLAGLGAGGEDRDLKLSTDQVKKLADASLILTGNPRLKVGNVKEKDADTISVDIVTVDNALVVHRDVDRHTGRVSRPD